MEFQTRETWKNDYCGTVETIMDIFPKYRVLQIEL